MTHGSLDTNSSPLWADLVAAALLGTERRPPAMPPVGGALGDLLGRLAPGEDPPAALLGAAAAVALYQRAGWAPPAGGAPPFPPCPPDDLAPCLPRAGEHLAQMLAGTHAAALPEWLAALAASGRGAPAALLPALLDYGQVAVGVRSSISNTLGSGAAQQLADAGRPDLRPLIVAVLGARGRWLAGLNPAWDYALVPDHSPAGEEATALWETGSRHVRRAVLRQLRGADPARARELLAATWATEKADERATLLLSFGQGLSIADEPFLEQALDDRAERVRHIAANLLAFLPDSRLSRRMIARLTPLLTWQPGRLLQRASLSVALPADYDEGMRRDGVAHKPAGPGVGEKAWWLGQMLELAPPATWGAEWGATPGEILAAKLPKEWRDLLLASWASAARRHADQPWLEALVDHARSGKAKLSLSELLPALPPARREQIALGQLQGDVHLAGDSPALAALRSLPGIWGHALARAALAALSRHLSAGDKAQRSDWHLRTALETFALHMPPADLADETAAMFSDEMRELPYSGAGDHPVRGADALPCRHARHPARGRGGYAAST